jgi:hypothetical protein
MFVSIVEVDMDLNGEVVKHKKFGVGTVIESMDDSILVLFDETKEKKRFLYPEAMGDYLELQNRSTSANEMKNEQTRLNDIKKTIKRHKNIKKIIGFRLPDKKG